MNLINKTQLALPIRGNAFILFLFLFLVVTPWHWFLSGQIDLTAILASPSWHHPLGTDNLGRDLLVRVVDVLRWTILPMWLVVLLATALGIAAATLAIYLQQYKWGQPIVFCVYLLVVALAAIPIGILAFLWSVWQQHANFFGVILPVGVLLAIRTYLQTLDLFNTSKNLSFWRAHESMGGSLGKRLIHYGILGEWRLALVATTSFHLQAAVAVEAALSYLGFGVQEPQPSFGNMLASHFDNLLRGEWWVCLVIVLGLALSALVPQCLFKYYAVIMRRHFKHPI